MNGQFLTSFDGAKIYYHKTIKDKNNCLIFIHGLGGDLTAWQKERSYFTKLGISSVALDLRGHGLSERRNDEDFYKLEKFSKDVLSLIETEKLINPVVIGHCFGGMVSMNFQAQFPKSSQGLVLIDTSYKPPFFSFSPMERFLFTKLIKLMVRFLPDLKIEGHRNFNDFINTSDINIKRFLSDILHTSLRSYLTICEQLVNLNAEKLLDKITVPTLVISGTDDTIFPPEIAKYLNKRIKKSELELIEGANHILVLNNPQDLSKSINGFLQRIDFI